MAGFQRLIALGNVTKDPDIRQFDGGEVAKFSIAVNGYKDSVEYFDVEWWKPNGALAYVAKGTPVLVEGELQTQKWEKDGQPRSKAFQGGPIEGSALLRMCCYCALDSEGAREKKALITCP